MPYPPDSDTTDPNDAPRSTTAETTAETSAEASGRQDDRSAGWARRARTG